MSVQVTCPSCEEFKKSLGWSTREVKIECRNCNEVFRASGVDGILETGLESNN